ncbi:hypothetical protein I6M38_16540 [Shewanella algae]|nr:hypothetical protein [Shewanella algae]
MSATKHFSVCPSVYCLYINMQHQMQMITHDGECRHINGKNSFQFKQ